MIRRYPRIKGRHAVLALLCLSVFGYLPASYSRTDPITRYIKLLKSKQVNRRIELILIPFFITARVLRHRGMIEESEFVCVAQGVRERREKHGLLQTAHGFAARAFRLSPGHAILYPRSPLTMSRVMEASKVGSTPGINARRLEFCSRRGGPPASSGQALCPPKTGAHEGRPYFSMPALPR